MDDTDTAVLATTLHNARRPVSWLSRRLGLTRDVVSYRLRRMEKKGVIKGYVAKVAINRFCEGICNLGLKLKGFDQERLGEIIGYLKGHSSVGYMAELCGEYDMVAVLLYKDTEDLARIVSDITGFAGDNLRSHGLWLYVTELKNDRLGLLRPGRQEHHPVTFKKTKTIEFDHIDLRLLEVLSQSCRQSNKQIADRLGVSEELVRQRIRKLEDRGVIYGYMVIMDHSKLGYQGYYMNLQMEDMTEKTLKKVRRYIEENPNLCYCAHLAGNFNLHFSVYAKNRAHYSEILSDIRSHFGSELVDYSFQLLMREHKERFAPKGFFEGLL